jgi:hypothetical protein
LGNLGGPVVPVGQDSPDLRPVTIPPNIPWRTIVMAAFRVLVLKCLATCGLAVMVTSAHGQGNRPPSPDWTRYAYGEALIMGRDNQAFERTLVTDIGGVENFLSAQSPQYPFGGGFRTFYGAIGPDCRGWEVGYFGLYNLTAAASTSAAAVGTPLYLPGALGFAIDPVGADLATVTTRTTINSAEANVFHHFERWNDRRDAWMEIDWLTGFRYVNVEDAATIGLVCCNGTSTPSYDAGTSNNMFGGQLGGRARWNWNRWAIETWGKAGLLGNFQSQYQGTILDENGALVRDARSSTGTTAGMIADINLTAIYRLTDTWGIRAGYNVIWLGGIAQALNQFDFSAASTAGTLLQQSGSVFLTGANLGLEARW